MQINISGGGAVLLTALGVLALALVFAPDATTGYVNGLADAVTGV